MNTQRLARHYEQLTPWERVPLIQAASLRGDLAERDRLARSTPMHGFRIPNYWGLSEGLQSLAHLVLLLHFDLAAHYWRGLTLLTDLPEVFAPEEAEQRGDRLWESLRLLAFRSVRLADAWRMLCAGLTINGDALLRHLPGAATIKRFAEEARAVAFTPEEAQAFLRRGVDESDAVPGERSESHLETADDLAAELREYLAAHLANWS